MEAYRGKFCGWEESAGMEAEEGSEGSSRAPVFARALRPTRELVLGATYESSDEFHEAMERLLRGVGSHARHEA